MRKAKWICLEGSEGCGKTTYTKMLADHFTGKGLKVLSTKEPGTPLSPLTMVLRGIMLDAQYESQLTTTSRELISQAIRSIHMEKIVKPALEEYDYIIQDRGILSGLAYGKACGNSHEFLMRLVDQVTAPIGSDPLQIYDLVIYLKSNAARGLARAKAAKQEFAVGDAIEARGEVFMQQVARNMDRMVYGFPYCTIDVGDKTIAETFKEILQNVDDIC